MPRLRVGPAVGVGLIWAFLILFLIYPLGRIFYDAVTDEAGRWTLANFREFFTDRFYLRSLVNSMILGVATVFFASVLGIAVAFLLVRYDFAGRNLFSYLTMIPIISPPLVGVLGFTFILGRAGTVNVLLMDLFDMLRPVNFLYGLHGVVLVETLHLFPMITLNVVDALGKVDPVARGGGGERGRARLVQALAGDPAADHAGLRGGRAARLHLDVLRLRHAARAGRAGPPGPAGLPQHRAVRGPAHLPHGHRDLRADGAARDPLPAGRAALRGDQGLLLAVLLEDRAAAALARRGRRWSSRS